MIRLRRFFDEGSAGGGASAAVVDPPEGSSPSKADDGSGGSAAGVSDPGKVEPGDKKTEAGDGATPNYQEMYEAEKAKNETATKEHEDRKSRVGTLANELSSFKKLDEALKSKNPQTAMSELAKMYKIDLPVPTKDEVKLTDDDGGFLPDNMAAFKDQLKAEMKAETKAEFAKEFSTLHEANLVAKYPDWDENATARDSIMRSVIANDLSHSELHHLAVRGTKMPEVIKAAEARGRQGYIDELQTKAGGGRSPAGGSGADGDKKTEGVQSFHNEEFRNNILARRNQG